MAQTRSMEQVNYLRDLTDAEQKVMVAMYVARGLPYCLSNREICVATGIKSVGHVQLVLRRLIDLGFVGGLLDGRSRMGSRTAHLTSKGFMLVYKSSFPEGIALSATDSLFDKYLEVECENTEMDEAQRAYYREGLPRIYAES